MLIGLPLDDVIWDATLTMTNESTDPAYEVENVQDNDPSNTARSTGTASDITVDVVPASPDVEIVIAAVCNTNATTMSVTSGAGLNESISAPTRTDDGKQRNGYVDTSNSTGRTDNQFVFHLSKTGSVELEVGRLVLLKAVYDIPVLWEAAGELEFGESRPGEYENVTRLGTTWRRASPVAAPRRMRGTVNDITAFDTLRRLQAQNRGLNKPFFFAPYDDVNDWWFSQIVLEEHTWNPKSFASTVMTLHVVEVSMGLPPDLD